MSHAAGNDVFVTKVCIPDTRVHQLLSVIKSEPKDYDSNHCDVVHSEPPRKILPAVSVPSGSTGSALSVASTGHPSCPVDVRSGQSSMVNLVGPYGVAGQTNSSAPHSQQHAPAIGHGVSNATLLSHPSVAVSSFTAIAPLFVSNLIPSDLRKQSEPLNNSNLLPTLINSSTNSSFGLINPCHFSEHSSYPAHLQSHQAPNTVISHVTPRLNVFTQLVTRGPSPASTAAVQGPIPVTSTIGSTHPNPALLSGFTSSAGTANPVLRPRFSPVSWSANTSASAANPSPELINPVATASIPPSPQYTCRASGPIVSAVGGTSLMHRNSLENTAGIGISHPSTVPSSSSSSVQLHHSVRPTDSTREVPQQATSDAQSTIVSNAAPSNRVPTNSPSPTSPVCPSGPAPNSDSLLWGRLVRLSEGDVVFPGLGRLLFSSPQSVLRQIRRTASSEESLSLQLPSSTVTVVPATESRVNNWLSPAATKFRSRKGFHVCLCCHQTFTNRALYDSHMKRPVARILYRCHLCRGSETAHLPVPVTTANNTSTTSNHSVDALSDGANQNGTAGNAVPETTVRANSLCAHSPYCTVLSGGIIKAPNQCAIYTHMACMHPDQVSAWALLPSLLTVCPLSESAWTLPSFQLAQYLRTAESPRPTARPINSASKTDSLDMVNTAGNQSAPSIQCLKTTEDVGAKGNTAPVPPSATGQEAFSGTPRGAADIFAAVEPKDESTFYRPGMELTELWCDLERALNEAISYQPLNFLTPSVDREFDPSRFICLSTDPDNQSTYSLRKTGLTPNPGKNSAFTQRPGFDPIPGIPSSSSDYPPLPAPDSALAQTILLCASSDLWKTHLFLSTWCQQTRPIPTHLDSSSNPIVITEDDEDERPQNASLSPTAADLPASPQSEVTMNMLHSLAAPAPSPAELNQVVSHLEQLSEFTKPNAPAEEPRTKSGQLRSVTDAAPVTNTDRRGLLRCLICDFRTETPKELRHHLSGTQPFTLTKCALCGQAVCIRQRNLCAVKAHLLLHLGCFLMCPQCGFTPAAHLAPDAAELCLRIHLRFVCFHYNVLQVYLCTQCQGQCKAFHSLTNLYQHYFDRHSTRLYACLRCARQTGSGAPVPGSGRHSLGGPPPTSSTAESKEEARASDVTPSAAMSAPRSKTPDRNETAPPKPCFSFTSIRELRWHMRASHRYALSIPTTSSILTSTGTSVPLTTSTNSNISLAHLSVVTNAPSTQKTSEADCAHSETEQRRSPKPALFNGNRVSLDLSGSADNRPAPWTTGGSSTNTDDPASTVRPGDNQTPFCLALGVDFACGYKCSECDQVLDHRDSFTRHFRLNHPWSFSSVGCYRCFGSCRRLSYNLEEFRQHAASCTSARNMFLRTFTILTTSKPGMRFTPEALLSSSGHPLCFCSYCGIGARRLDNPTVVAEPPARPLDSPRSSSESASELVIDERDPQTTPPAGVPSSTASETVDAPTPVSAPGNLKEPVYDACYFSDLVSLRTHESQYHRFENSSQIACPWCGYRLSCFTRRDLRFTKHHLRLHLHKHNLALWTMERYKRWNKPTRANLTHCSCGSALLDSPLALASHCSAHLLARNPLLSHSDLSSRPDPDAIASRTCPGVAETVSDLDQSAAEAPKLSDPADSAITSPGTMNAKSSKTPQLVPGIRQLPLPSYSAHIPCSVEVYRHLRFAEFPELDRYLDRALSESPHSFLCPICHVPVFTRWELTQHAFIEHWGVLCFICCDHIDCDSSRPCVTVKSGDQSEPTASNQPNSDTENSSSSGHSHQPDESQPNPISTVSPKAPNLTGHTKVEDEATVKVNFWTHVYHCLDERGQMVRRARRTAHEAATNDDCLVVHYPVEESKADLSSVQQDADESELQRCSPIVIPSSSESGPSSDDEPDLSNVNDSDLHDHNPDRPLSRSTSETTPARTSPMRVDCGENDHDMHSAESTEQLASADLENQSAHPLHNGDSVPSLQPAPSLPKRRRLSTELNMESPASSLISETSDSRAPDDSSSCEPRICVLCGESKTADNWEEHLLSHRNPYMAWNGLELSDPNRIVLTPSRPSVFRCYLCKSRFVSRYNCRRHMATVHGVNKAQVDWKLLSEGTGMTACQVFGSSNNTVQERGQNQTARRESSAHRRRASSSGSQQSHPSPKKRTNLERLRSSSGCTNSWSDQVLNPDAESLPHDDSQSQYRCTQCAIQFMSHRSLTIHQLAAHSSGASR